MIKIKPLIISATALVSLTSCDPNLYNPNLHQSTGPYQNPYGNSGGTYYGGSHAPSQYHSSSRTGNRTMGKYQANEDEKRRTGSQGGYYGTNSHGDYQDSRKPRRTNGGGYYDSSNQ